MKHGDENKMWRLSSSINQSDFDLESSIFTEKKKKKKKRTKQDKIFLKIFKNRKKMTKNFQVKKSYQNVFEILKCKTKKIIILIGKKKNILKKILADKKINF